MASRRRRSKRPPKSRLALRWLGVAALCLVAFLYYRPAQTFLHKRATVAARTAEVRRLQAEHVRLQRLVEASTSNAALAREARRLGLVRPGERLFIVKGIARWEKQHAVTLGSSG
jgi:cell division protein FtsB